jgi:hypothetical protein
MKILIIPVFILSLVALTACEKNGALRTVPENFDLSNKGFLKIINVMNGSPVANVYINSTKVTGAVFGFAGSFPASTTYSVFDPGTKSVNIKDTLSVTKLNLTTDINLAAGKFYTAFVYDTLATAKYKVVEDAINITSDTSARLRFVNLIFTSSPVTNVDIFSKKLSTNIFTNIATESVTDFISHPSKITDTFYVRPTGTTTNLSSLAFTPGESRNYTMVFRGRYQTTSGTLARTLSLFTNY